MSERVYFGVCCPSMEAKFGSCYYRHKDGHEVQLYSVSETPDEELKTLPADAYCCGEVTQWLRNSERRNYEFARTNLDLPLPPLEPRKPDIDIDNFMKELTPDALAKMKKLFTDPAMFIKAGVTPPVEKKEVTE
jgi:hypothetical protein